jgi:hypothetical protein
MDDVPWKLPQLFYFTLAWAWFLLARSITTEQSSELKSTAVIYMRNTQVQYSSFPTAPEQMWREAPAQYI